MKQNQTGLHLKKTLLLFYFWLEFCVLAMALFPTLRKTNTK